MIGQVQEIDGNKVAVPISGSIPTGLPVGTWISFEKDQAPDNKWIKAGETFDENLYPALYLFLGTNVVPERFDHNRLGSYEDFTISTSSSSQTEVTYDGFLFVSWSINSNNGYVRRIYINDVEYQNIGSNPQGTTNQTLHVPVKKGDKVYINTTAYSIKARFYKHPMFIKATSAIEITDQNTFLNTVQSLVQTSNSYSTEEQATGGFWIDGKPIYRKTIYIGNATLTSGGQNFPHGINNFKKLVKGWKTFHYNNYDYMFWDNSINFLCDTTNIRINTNSNLSVTELCFVLEYTKN